MARILEIRVELTDNPSDDDINEIGEQLQLELPIFFNDYDFRTGNITFEIKNND